MSNDLIDVFVKLMETDNFTGPVNIGNPGEFTMLELAELVIHKVGGKSKITFRPLPSDDPRERQPDITLAKTRLGWEPKISLSEGLDHTIAYFSQLLKSPALHQPRPMKAPARQLTLN